MDDIGTERTVTRGLRCTVADGDSPVRESAGCRAFQFGKLNRRLDRVTEDGVSMWCGAPCALWTGGQMQTRTWRDDRRVGATVAA